eukprot:gene25602-11254_t
MMASRGNRKLLIPVDETSDGSVKVFDYTLDQIYKEGDMVHLFHCIPPGQHMVFPTGTGMDDVLVDYDPQTKARMEKEARKKLNSKFVSKLEERKFGDVICRRAKDLGAMVVMGRHPKGKVPHRAETKYKLAQDPRRFTPNDPRPGPPPTPSDHYKGGFSHKFRSFSKSKLTLTDALHFFNLQWTTTIFLRTRDELQHPNSLTPHVWFTALLDDIQFTRQLRAQKKAFVIRECFFLDVHHLVDTHAYAVDHRAISVIGALAMMQKQQLLRPCRQAGRKMLVAKPQVSSQPSVSVAPKQKIKGRTVVITGGSQGVGRATARMYAKEGYNVVVVARQPERLQEVAAECIGLNGRKDSALAIPMDVKDADAVRQLAEQVESTFESIDIVINNAGICATGKLADMPESEIINIMAVNFTGPTLVAKAFTPMLKAAAAVKAAKRTGGPKPALVMVNSFAARMPLKHMSIYTASKYALAGMTDALRYEMAPDGIQVCQVHPGVINSNFLERAGWYGPAGETAEKALQQLLASGQGQTPEEVAQAVVRAVEKGEDEVVVGALFNGLVKAYQVTGANPMAMAS